MNKIVVITGGASGLGLEIAKQFLQADHNVAIISRSAEKLNKLQALKEEYYNLKILTIQADISNEQDVKRITETICKDYQIEFLVNNAGAIVAKHFSKNTIEDIETCYNPVIGAILLTSYVMPYMKACNSGKIVNIISSAGLLGKPMESVYSSSKFALKGFTNALRKELKDTNIKVVGVYPGGMNTQFFDKVRDYTPKYVSDKFMNPRKVAKIIVENCMQADTLNVCDIIIERAN